MMIWIGALVVAALAVALGYISKVVTPEDGKAVDVVLVIAQGTLAAIGFCVFFALILSQSLVTSYLLAGLLSIAALGCLYRIGQTLPIKK